MPRIYPSPPRVRITQYCGLSNFVVLTSNSGASYFLEIGDPAMVDRLMQAATKPGGAGAALLDRIVGRQKAAELRRIVRKLDGRDSDKGEQT
jgi:hypothetical protein